MVVWRCCNGLRRDQSYLQLAHQQCSGKHWTVFSHGDVSIHLTYISATLISHPTPRLCLYTMHALNCWTKPFWFGIIKYIARMFYKLAGPNHSDLIILFNDVWKIFKASVWQYKLLIVHLFWVSLVSFSIAFNCQYITTFFLYAQTAVC